MRLLNRLFAALLSLALIVVGVLLIIEVIADRTVHHAAVIHWHSSYSWAKHTAWTQGSLRVGCIVAAAVGLILLIAELKRPRVKRLRVADQGADGGHTDAAYTRKGVAGAVHTAVVDVDGVRSAQVAVTHRRVRVVAVTSARDAKAAQALAEPAQQAAQERLEALELRRTPRLKLTTTARKN